MRHEPKWLSFIHSLFFFLLLCNQSKTAVEPSKTHPDDPEDKPKKHDKGKSPKKKKVGSKLFPRISHNTFEMMRHEPKFYSLVVFFLLLCNQSKTAAEPSKTDPDDPEPPKTGADDPEHHKGKRQKKRKEVSFI